MGILTAGVVGVVSSPAAAAPTTFTVTSTDLCGGAGTFEQAVKDANANPGDDTIVFTAGLTYTGDNCYRTAGDLPSPIIVTESVAITGNDAVVDGGQVYLDPGGNVNRPYECPISGRLQMLARTSGFLQVGAFGGSTGVAASVTGIELKNFATIASVNAGNSLILQRVRAHDIIDFNLSCNAPLIDARTGADVTIRDSQIYDSATPRGLDPTGMIMGRAGDLVLERSDIGESAFPRAISWTGGTVTIVSSRILAGGGLYLEGAVTEMVNSAFWSRGEGETNRILTTGANGRTTLEASTVYWTEPAGTGIQADRADDSVVLSSTAVGANTRWRGATPLLLDDSTRFTVDDSSWAQALPGWDPSAFLPGLLDDSGLPDNATSGGVWIDAVTPLPTGVLVDAIPQADGANALRSPIDNSVITLDVLGNPRTDAGQRSVGAVQSDVAPDLTVLGMGDATVDLGWNPPKAPTGRTIDGYTVGYRILGGSWNDTVAVPGGTTVGRTVTGLVNGTDYEFRVRAEYDDPSFGPWSNVVSGTPFGAISAPSPSATPGEEQIRLFWTAPDLGGHAGPVSYYVVFRPVGATNWFTGPGPLAARTTLITGLTGGVTYELGVFAASTDGAFSSTGSTTATPTAPPEPPLAPGPPLNVTAVAGDGVASVAWTPPASPGTSPIASYLVTSAPGGQTCRAVAPDTTCEVVGLTNGTTYTFTVRALSLAGEGPASDASNPVTPSAAVVPAIVISGSRDSGPDAGRVFVQGVSTGLVGRQVTPRVKLQGEMSYQAGVGVRTISADGTFEWQRRTGKKIYVYFTAGGGIRSNRVIIPGQR